MAGVSSVGGIVIPVMVIRGGDKAALIRLKAELMGVANTVREVNTSMAAQTVASGKATKGVKGFLKGMTNVRWALVNVMLVVMTVKAAFNLLGKPLIDLETEMATVQKRTKMSDEALKELKYELIDLSRTLPESASEIAKLAGIAGQLGIRGAENISEFSRVTAMMGAATVLSSEEAALALAKLSQAFGMSIDEIESMGSAINELSNTTAANSKEISAAMLKMATSANQLGITADAAAAVGATLVDMGMKAERAGTRMRGVFIRMATETEKIAALFGDRLGPEVAAAIGEDANQALLDVVKAISQMDSETERVTKTTEIFGRIGGSAVLALASNYLELKMNVIAASREFEEATSLQNEFDIQMSTAANQWKIYWGNIGSGWANFTSKMNMPITGMLSFTNDMKSAKREFKSLYKATREEQGLKLNTQEGQQQTSLTTKYSRSHIKAIAQNYVNDYAGFRETLLAGIDEENRTELREMEVDFYFKYNTGDIQGAFKVLEDYEVKFYKNLQDRNTKSLAEMGLSATQVQQQLTGLYRNILASDTPAGDTAAYEALLTYKEQFVDISEEEIVMLDALAQSAAQLQDRYNTIDPVMLGLKVQLDNYNEALEINLETHARLGLSNEAFLSSLDDIKSQYSDAASYQEDYNRLNKLTSTTIDETSMALKRASLIMGMVNDRMTDEVKEAKDEYASYKNYILAGEQEQLNMIFALEQAINKERLAQLKLEQATAKTNATLDGQQDSYEAWVQTVQEFIKQTVSSGQSLGANVTNAVQQYQTLLLSTSKFSGSDDSSESDALSDLRTQREIAQLEYGIQYDAQRRDVDTYISALDGRTATEFASSQAAITSLGSIKDEVDSLVKKQEGIADSWEADKKAADLMAAGFTNVKDIMSSDINTLIELAKKLQGEYNDTITAFDDMNDAINPKEEDTGTKPNMIKMVRLPDGTFAEPQAAWALNNPPKEPMEDTAGLGYGFGGGGGNSNSSWGLSNIIDPFVEKIREFGTRTEGSTGTITDIRGNSFGTGVKPSDLPINGTSTESGPDEVNITITKDYPEEDDEKLLNKFGDYIDKLFRKHEDR